MSDSLKIMAVVCHPADAIDGAGGTLCLHAARGDDVSVVVCTHGVDTHDLRRNDKLRFEGAGDIAGHEAAIEGKEQEVIAGMKILGVSDVRFLRIADSVLTVTTELIEAQAEVMADVQPHLPANEHLMKLASTSTREHYKDMRIMIHDMPPDDRRQPTLESATWLNTTRSRNR